MAYKDTKFKQVCPYNEFKECFYDDCPFFSYETDTRVDDVEYDRRLGPMVHRVTYISSIGCRKVEAEVRASEHSPNNVEVNVRNNTAVHSSLF